MYATVPIKCRDKLTFLMMVLEHEHCCCHSLYVSPNWSGFCCSSSHARYLIDVLMLFCWILVCLGFIGLSECLMKTESELQWDLSVNFGCDLSFLSISECIGKVLYWNLCTFFLSFLTYIRKIALIAYVCFFICICSFWHSFVGFSPVVVYMISWKS